MTAAETTTVARCWQIRRRDGMTLGFTDHDQTLSFAGQQFRPDSGMTARAVVQATGLSIDNTEAEGALSDAAISERDLLAGRWDGAQLQMWEVDWTDTASRRLVFGGQLGEVARSNGAFRAELRGLSEPLNAPLGRVYHPRCSAELGDAACGVDLTADNMRVGATILTAAEGRIFRFASFPAFEPGWFERGILTMASGEAASLFGRIKNDLAHPDGSREIELWSGLGIAPRTGDRADLMAGCDKRGETCRLKFANMVNFRGFPHLPSEDWLIAPQIGGRDGG